MDLNQVLERLQTAEALRQRARSLRAGAIESWQSAGSTDRKADLPYVRGQILEQSASLLEQRSSLAAIVEQFQSVREGRSAYPADAIELLLSAVEKDLSCQLERLEAASRLVNQAEELSLDSSEPLALFINWTQLGDRLCEEVAGSLRQVSASLDTLAELVARGQATVLISRCCA